MFYEGSFLPIIINALILVGLGALGHLLGRSIIAGFSRLFRPIKVRLAARKLAKAKVKAAKKAEKTRIKAHKANQKNANLYNQNKVYGQPIQQGPVNYSTTSTRGKITTSKISNNQLKK